MFPPQHDLVRWYASLQ